MSNESKSSLNLELLSSVTIEIRVEIGRKRMPLKQVLELGEGSVVELQKLAGEPMDVYANEKLIAKGECVVVNESFGVRITHIVGTEENQAA
jgi:flagellar motor switch protein FliN